MTSCVSLRAIIYRRPGSVLIPRPCATWARLCVAVVGSLVAIGCGGGIDSGAKPVGAADSKAAASYRNLEIIFTDVTAPCGVDFTYRNGADAGKRAILESLGGGVGIFDFDGDLRPDLYLPGGGAILANKQITSRGSGLFRNVGNCTFNEVSEQASVAATDYYTHGCTAGDFDNDGFQDLLVTGYGGLQLFRNQGDGTFQPLDPALTDHLWSTSAAWGDVNGDGYLDLYVAHYVDWSFENHPFCSGPQGQKEICPPKDFAPLPDSLFINQRDGQFVDLAGQYGLRDDGKGLGVVIADIDADLDVDIYVANDTTDNFLYRNDHPGKYTELGFAAGVAVDERGTANGSMGVELCDFNSDGLFDLWVANYEREMFALYKNIGGHFVYATHSAGISALGQTYVSWGTACLDIDLDGDQDILVSNGHVLHHPANAPTKQEPLLLVNESGQFRRFMFPPPHFMSEPQHGRGLAVGDLDSDGDYDVVVSRQNDPAVVLRNDTPAQRSPLSVRLVGTGSNRDAIGAVISLRDSHGQQFRQIVGGGSYLSHSDRALRFGVGSNSSAATLLVTWPTGKKQEVRVDSQSRSIVLLEEYDKR